MRVSMISCDLLSVSEGPFDSLAFAQGILQGLACHERAWRLARGEARRVEWRRERDSSPR